MRRIEHHPVLGAPRGEPITIWVDDQPLEVLSTDTVASALWANGRRGLRYSRNGQPRGMYCGIGHCFECRVTVEFETGVRSCLQAVSPGMRVYTEVSP